MRLRGIAQTVLRLAAAVSLAVFLALSGNAVAGAASLNVTGVVADQNGQPLPNVAVSATSPGGSTIEFGPVLTGADGSYGLAVGPGTYDFHFIPPAGSGLNPVVDSNVTVSADQVLDVQLTALTYTLSGTVTDGQGNPVTGVAMDASSASTVMYGQTDAAGSYSMSGVPGVYSYLEFYPLETVPVPPGWPSSFTLRENPGASYDLTGGDLVQNFQLDTVPLTVVVNDASGSAVPNAQVTGSSSGGTTSVTAGGPADASIIGEGDQATTGADGTATMQVFKGVRYAAGRVCASIGLTSVCNTQPLTVTTPTTITLQQPLTYTLSGTVTDGQGNPVTGVAMDASSASTVMYGQTDAAGSYSMSGVPGVYSYLEFYPLETVPVPPGWPSSFTLRENPGASYDLTGGDLVQNFQLDTVPLTVVVNDASGSAVPNAQVTGSSSGGTTSVTAGGPADASIIGEGDQATTGADGTATMQVFKGVRYAAGRVCASIGLTSVCNTQPLTVTTPTTIVFQPQPAIPAAPVGLSAATPTRTAPALSWNAVAAAASYRVYRNGVQVGTSSTSQFTDAGLSADGSYTYTVTAVNRSAVEGPSSAPVVVVYDTTPPAVSAVAVSPAVITEGGGTTLSADVSDALSGISAAEYFVGADPGPGNGTAMTVASGSATATLGSSLPAGTYTVSVRAQDQAGNWSSPASAQLTVKPPAPSGLSAASPTAVPVLNWTAVAGASSYNVYRDGAIIGSAPSPSYTDSSAVPGPHTYQITAVAAGVESDLSNRVNVLVGTAAAITSAASASTGMRVPLDFTVTTTGAPTPSLTESGALPPGVTFTEDGDGTADIAGIAAAGSAGSYPVTITATNGIGSPATQSFTLTVTTAASAPAITSDPADTETLGAPFTFTVTTTGYPAPDLTKTGPLPPGVTFTDNGDGTATIAGTPDRSAVGTYPLTLTAKNPAGTATQAFTLTITKAPVIKKITNPTAHTGTAFTKTITAVGSPTPALTETGALPAGLAFTDNGNGTATLAGTPAATAGGAYPITITATNSLGTTSATFTLKIDQPPAITSPDNATASTGSPFTFPIATTGYPAPRLAKLGALPKGLTFKAGTGTISGIPASGTAGTYQITITATNSSGTTTQTFTLRVT